MLRRVTIADIAKYAGVSPAAVSLILNGKYTRGPTARETAERVLDTAQSLGYRGPSRARPEPGIASLGLLIADRDAFFSTFYGPRLMRGMWRAAEKHAAHLLLLNLNEEVGGASVSFERLLKELESHQVRDLVLNVNSHLSDELLSVLQKITVTGMRVVALWRRPEGWDIPCVGADDFGAVDAIVSHLTALGHRRIALIATEADPRTRAIANYFSTAAREAGATISPDGILYENNVVSGSTLNDEEAVSSLLNVAEPPTAIFAMYDGRALGVTLALQTLGYSVPDDVSVIGFGNMRETDNVRSTITMVESPIEEIGEMAARLALDPKAGYARLCASAPVRLPIALRVRSTTAPAAQTVLPTIRGTFATR